MDPHKDIAKLAELLLDTAEHHGAFEAASAPHDWWHWYAPYLSARLDGKSQDEATAAADKYMNDVHGVPRTVASGV